MNKANSKKAIKIALWCLLGAVLLFIFIVLGSLLIQKYIKKSSVPMFMGYASMIVATGSMNGTIDQGDMIIVKKTDDYELGDIVTYIKEEGKLPITHRLINYGDEEGTFIVKGDANNTPDEDAITIEQIAGEVVLVIPKVGLFFEWFTNGGGVIYVVAFIAIIIAGMYFLGVIKGEQNADEATANASVQSSIDTGAKTQDPVDADQADNDSSQDGRQS